MIVSSDRRSKLRKETREQTHRLHFRTYTTYFHVISRKNQRQAVLNLGRVQRFRAEYVRFMLWFPIRQSTTLRTTLRTTLGMLMTRWKNYCFLFPDFLGGSRGWNGFESRHGTLLVAMVRFSVMKCAAARNRSRGDLRIVVVWLQNHLFYWTLIITNHLSACYRFKELLVQPTHESSPHDFNPPTRNHRHAITPKNDGTDVSVWDTHPFNEIISYLCWFRSRSIDMLSKSRCVVPASWGVQDCAALENNRSKKWRQSWKT